MIKIVFADGVLEMDSVMVQYYSIKRPLFRDRVLSAKMLRKMWLSGNNGHWAIYFKGWRNDITIATDGTDGMLITVNGKMA